MYCVNHETVESVTLCHSCGRPICQQCQHDVRGVNYCPECLAQAMEKPKPAMVPPKTPGLAAFLAAVVPGLGAVYNGQYIKAVAFLAVFAGIIQGLTNVGGAGEAVFLSVAMACFWFYMLFDAYSSAKAINEKPVDTSSAIPMAANDDRESLTGGIVITAIGLLFQLNNFDIHIFRNVLKLWPLVIIIIGIIMLKNYFASSSAKDEEGK